MAKLQSGTRIYGTANVDSSLAVGGVIYAPGNTASTSNTTGTIVVTGGIGVTGNIFSTGIITGTYSGSGAGLTGTATGLTANVANYESVTTATTGTYYPQLALGVSGTYASYANSALSFAAATGTLSATAFSGSGASLTSLTAGNLSGTIPSAVLGNSTLYVGTTAIALNRASATLALTGISSVTLPGSSSGTAQIIPSAAAGTGTVITLPATTGTVITTGDTGTVTSTMIADSTIVNGDISASAAIAVSKLAASTISGITLGSNLNSATFNNGGAGGASGSTFNGSTALTISYNTIGASPLAGSASLTTTGTVTSGTWSGSFGAVSGANLTNLTAGNLSGTIPSAVLGNSTLYVGTTAILLNRSTASQALTGITSIDGYAADVAGGASNQLLYQTGSNATDYVTAPTTANTVLTWTGAGFSWNVAATGSGGGANLSSVSTSTTYYLGLSANTSGTWTDARIDISNLYYSTSSNTLYATNYNTASDRELKDNIIVINKPLDTVNKINAVEFTWKNTGKKSYGVIAQELEQILPELVDDIEGRKTVNYNALIGFLIGAVKELSEKVDSLEKK